MTFKLDGETRLTPIIGDPIAQVKSPALLSSALAERGENSLVVPMHVKAGRVETFFRAICQVENVSSIIATVPHKVDCISLCDRTSRRATFAGSVNIMRRESDGRWFGDNTDGKGFVNGVIATGFNMVDKRVLLVGVGGAGAAIAYELLASGARYLGIREIDEVKRDAIIKRLDAEFPGKVGAADDDPRGYDLIGNATPVGMNESDPLPVQAELFVAGQTVGDAITRPEVTSMLQIARDRGCTIMPGLGMFNAQARIMVDFLLGLEID